MDTQMATQKIWDYMLLHHPLKKADVLLVLGNRDTRVAEYTAQLYHEGWAPLILCTGSGTIHNHKQGRERFVGTTEAELFADIMIESGVPKEVIIIENESQNTGQNYEFGLVKLRERGVVPTRMILVHVPYAERRAYATGKVWLPNVELIVTSPPLSCEEFQTEVLGGMWLMNALVAQLQRIKEHPDKGFQIQQDIPMEVWDAYEYLIAQGYTERLIPEGE